MNDSLLDRAHQIIGVDDFRALTKLHIEHEWIQDENDALFQLW